MNGEGAGLSHFLVAIKDFGEPAPTEFVDGEAAGLSHFLAAIKDFGEPAPCIFKDTGSQTAKPVLKASASKYKETRKVSYLRSRDSRKCY